MNLNKSQILIIETIFSASFGIPNIRQVFTEEIIKIGILNSIPNSIFFISILKICLIIMSIKWLIDLIKYIRFTHKVKSKRVFDKYILNLVLTFIITTFFIIIIKN